MSLFQYGFHPVSRCASGETVQQSTVIPAHVLLVEESDLSMMKWLLMVFLILLTHHHPREGGLLEVNTQYIQQKAGQK